MKVRYWIDYVVPGKKPIREPVDFSIDEARTAMGKRKAQKVEAPSILQRLPERKMTFQQLTDWYLEQDAVKAKKYFDTFKINIASFNKVFGNKIITQVTKIDLENYQTNRKAAGYSDSYIDQEVGAAKTIINAAYMNKKVSSDTVLTFQSVKKLLKRNSNKRNRILSISEFHNLLNNVPKHTLAILATAFHMGMRKSEILTLRWTQVNLDARTICLKASQTKDSEPREIFINNDLLEILNSIPQQSEFVFIYRGKPIRDIRTGIIEGCPKAGIPYGRSTEGGFVFHDLRHTFNTFMRKAGVPQSVRMAITGHATAEMENRYDSIDDSDMVAAFNAHKEFLKANGARNGKGTEHTM